MNFITTIEFASSFSLPACQDLVLVERGRLKRPKHHRYLHRPLQFPSRQNKSIMCTSPISNMQKVGMLSSVCSAVISSSQVCVAFPCVKLSLKSLFYLDLSTRSGLKRVHVNFSTIYSKLENAYEQCGENYKIKGGIVGIVAKMCVDSLLRNKLFGKGTSFISCIFFLSFYTSLLCF